MQGYPLNTCHTQATGYNNNPYGEICVLFLWNTFCNRKLCSMWWLHPYKNAGWCFEPKQQHSLWITQWVHDIIPRIGEKWSEMEKRDEWERLERSINTQNGAGFGSNTLTSFCLFPSVSCLSLVLCPCLAHCLVTSSLTFRSRQWSSQTYAGGLNYISSCFSLAHSCATVSLYWAAHCYSQMRQKLLAT